MKKRTLLALLMIFAAALFAFAGCGQKQDETAKATQTEDQAQESKEAAKKDYIGTWRAKDEDEELTLSLDENGTFKMINTESDDGVVESATANGTYVVDGDKIKLTTEEVTADDRTDDGDDVVSELQDQMNITATYKVEDNKLTLTAAEGTPYILEEKATVTFSK